MRIEDEVRRTLHRRVADAEPSEEIRRFVLTSAPPEQSAHAALGRRLVVGCVAFIIVAASSVLLFRAFGEAPVPGTEPSPSLQTHAADTFHVEPGVGRMTVAAGS